MIYSIDMQYFFGKQLTDWFVSVFSESEPGVEGAGVSTPPVQSDLWPAALLGFDPDPHLHGLPGPVFPLSTTAELV